ncbi:MAG TPA: hypothetical protein VF384_11105, partial [Planctomycetota bacterium]
MRATTDAEGCYLLSQVMAGNAVLQAWHGTSRSKARIAREFVEGETFVWDAELEPEEEASWQRFEGSLVDEDGEPLGSWELRVGDPRNARNREAPYNRIHVGDTGTFRTNRVAPGTYELFVQPVQPKIGGEVGVGKFDVASCPLRIVVPRANVPTSRLRGRVVAPPALALAGNPRCYVWVLPEGAGRADRVKCDAEGRYEAGPLQRGRYRLRTESSLFGDLSIGVIEVVDGRDVDAGTFEAPMPGTLVVTMVDAQGTRRADAWVQVRPPGDDQRGGSLEHKDGIARGNLAPGRWRVATRDLTPMAAIDVDVRSGETTDVRFVIPDGVPFVLRVSQAAQERGRMQVRWLGADGTLLRELDVRAGGTDVQLSAPAGRYSLEVVDASGRSAASVDLRAGTAPQAVELPLPAAGGR